MTRNAWLRLEAILFFAQQTPLSSSVHLFLKDRASEIPPTDYREKACQTAACVLGPPFGVRHRRAQPFFLCLGASGGWPGQEEAVFRLKAALE